MSPRPRSSAICTFGSLAGAIGAVGPVTAIPAKLSPDGRAMASGASGNLRAAEALLSQSSEGIPFLRGDLVIRHDRLPFLGGIEGLSVSQLTSLILEFRGGPSVAVTL